MKLLRSLKKFGRCSVRGHGSKCSVTDEIRSNPYTRTQENREVQKQIELEIFSEEDEYES